MQDIEEKVTQVICQVMTVEAESVNRDSSPDTIGQWDSKKHMNLILSLEQTFGIQFSDEEIVKMLDVGLITQTVKEKIN